MPYTSKKSFQKRKSINHRISIDEVIFNHESKMHEILNRQLFIFKELYQNIPPKKVLTANNQQKTVRAMINRFRRKYLSCIYREMFSGLTWKIYVWKKNKLRSKIGKNLTHKDIVIHAKPQFTEEQFIKMYLNANLKD